jgi:shikimate kinase
MISSQPYYVPKTVSLVGMMGTGKSTIGVRLAKRLSLEFYDSDKEIERSSGGYTVSEIYDQWGEKIFSNTQTLVIDRLIKTNPTHILSTGEGAFIKEESRSILQHKTITVWLKTELPLIVERVRRKMRPQVKQEEDLEVALGKIMEERYPIYEMADICVESNDESYQEAVDRVFDALRQHLYPDHSDNAQH